MNSIIKDKIIYYQNLKGLNNNQLAKAAGINASTLNTLFSSKSDPTFATLNKICNGLGITLSQFFSTENDAYDLTDWHKELLKIADTLPNEKRSVLLTIIKEIK
ncbi:MAG: helix-turn-helix domain-containing protein [Firmicutes bacterium]|nr:helix-turn-helix domain-containing protein [Bacillota bacterium]